MPNITKIISAKVQRGSGLGRKLGFPTANLRRPSGLHTGVYLGLCRQRLCLVCIKDAVEVFLPNFRGNLYNKQLTLRLLQKIRKIQKFKSLKELKKQIKKDYQCLRELSPKQQSLKK